MTELEAYINHFYGTCNLGPKCQCLKTGWEPDICGNWNPCSAKTWEELYEWQTKKHNNSLP